MLGDSELKDAMIQVMEEEAWQKALYNHHSAKFNVMYAPVGGEECQVNLTFGSKLAIVGRGVGSHVSQEY